MRQPTTVRGVFLRAIRRIKRDGWCRGRYRRGTRWCLMGALEEGRVYSPLPGVARMQAHRAGYTIVWNDRQKSREPVLAALRQLAREAR